MWKELLKKRKRISRPRVTKDDLTLALATYDDPDGAMFTLRAAAMYHGIRNLVLVDNNPGGPYGEMLSGFCRNIGAIYVPMPDPVGTSPSREAAIAAAPTRWVVVCDSHVLFAPGTFEVIADYWDRHRESRDILHIDLIHESGNRMHSVFADKWRGQMWGVWTRAPESAQPVTIWGCGLGAFSIDKSYWPGFHPLQRGFGGEEGYIHEKIRRNGGRALLLPSPAGYWHRFARLRAPYRLTLLDKIRNYVFEFRELGLPLDRMRKHFVEGWNEEAGEVEQVGGWIPGEEFDRIAANPEAYMPESYEPLKAPPAHDPAEPKKKDCGCGGGTRDPRLPSDGPRAQPIILRSLEDWYNAHNGLTERWKGTLAALREAVGDAEHVQVIGLGDGGPLTAVCNRPRKVTVVDNVDENRGLFAMAVRLQRPEGLSIGASGVPVESDVAVISPVRHADDLYGSLRTLHSLGVKDIFVTGMLEEPEQTNEFPPRPGKMAGLRRFLREEPEWTAYMTSSVGVGFVGISRRRERKQEVPSGARRVLNFAKAVVDHVADGAEYAADEEIDRRLDICAVCSSRVDNKCGVCGCFLFDGPGGLGKVYWREQECPLGKW